MGRVRTTKAAREPKQSKAACVSRAILATLLAAASVPVGGLAAFAEPSEDAPYSEAVDRLADQLQAASDLDDSLTYVNENGYEVRLDGDDAALPDDAAQGAARQSLPESYIAPYTSVKDQGVLESCWAFSAIASFESAYLKQRGMDEQGTDAVDFSEAQAVYGTFNGKTGDGTVSGAELADSDNDHLVASDGIYGFGTPLNWLYVAGTLAAGRGVSYEGDIPLSVPEEFWELRECADEMAQAAASYDLTRVRLDSVEKASEVVTTRASGFDIERIWNESALAEVKQLLFDKGALSALCYLSSDPSSPYCHQAPDASCLPDAASSGEVPSGGGSPDAAADVRGYSPNYWVFDADSPGGSGDALDTNHVVTIVGWDDACSRWNFATPLVAEDGSRRAYDPDIAEVAEGSDGMLYIVPLIDGAWVVKNSWGTGGLSEDGTVQTVMGEEGMFYLSYCEKTMANPAAFVPDSGESGSSYAIVQQCDGMSPDTLGLQGDAKDCANVFAAEEDQRIEAVGAWVMQENMRVSVRVYTDLADPADPESGTLASERTGLYPNEGWYTIELDEPVPVDEGGTYSVVMMFEVEASDGSLWYYLPVEHASYRYPSQGYRGTGESFMESRDAEGNVEWVDTRDVLVSWGDWAGNVCIKAFANPADSGDSGDGGDEDGGGSGIRALRARAMGREAARAIPAAPASREGRRMALTCPRLPARGMRPIRSLCLQRPLALLRRRWARRHSRALHRSLPAIAPGDRAAASGWLTMTAPSRRKAVAGDRKRGSLSRACGMRKDAEGRGGGRCHGV